jgi:hypothetical protein
MTNWAVISFWRKTAPCNYSCYYCKERALVNWPSLPFNSMEKTPPWKATRRSASREFLNILLNPKFHYHVHKGLPLVPVLSRMNVIYNTTSYSSNINYNIILRSTSTSSQWALSLWLSHRNLLCFPLTISLSSMSASPCNFLLTAFRPSVRFDPEPQGTAEALNPKADSKFSFGRFF